MKFILAIVLLVCIARSAEVVKWIGYENSDCTGDELTTWYIDAETIGTTSIAECPDDTACAEHSKCSIVGDWPASLLFDTTSGRTALTMTTEIVETGTCSDTGTNELGFWSI